MRRINGSYSGFVKKISVTPETLSIFRVSNRNASDFSIAASFPRKYKSDLETFNFFKNLAENHSVTYPENVYKCYHPLWEDCIIEIKPS